MAFPVKHDIEKIKEAKPLIAQGVKLVEIAKLLDLKQGTVSAIKRGKIWREVQ